MVKNKTADAIDTGKSVCIPSALDFLILDSVKGFASAKQQRNAPNAGKTYHCVDDAAEQRGLTTADPSNDVKLKKPDATPVEGANDG